MDEDSTLRTLRVSRDGTTRTLFNFHYHAWPDHGAPFAARGLAARGLAAPGLRPLPDSGVPARPASVMRLLKALREKQPSDTGQPVVIHCSAGVGRTGLQCMAALCGLQLARVTPSLRRDALRHRHCLVPSEAARPGCAVLRHLWGRLVPAAEPGRHGADLGAVHLCVPGRTLWWRRSFAPADRPAAHTNARTCAGLPLQILDLVKQVLDVAKQEEAPPAVPVVPLEGAHRPNLGAGPRLWPFSPAPGALRLSRWSPWI